MSRFEQLLNILAVIAWVLFAIYAVYMFVQNLANVGAMRALIRSFSWRVLFPMLAPITLTLLVAAVVFVQPTEVAVIISLITPGGIRPQPLRAGLHLIVPILEEEEIYPIAWQTYTMSGQPNEGAKTGDDSIMARTNDGQEIRIDISVIFRINYEQVVTLHTDWQNRYVEDFVRPVLRGQVRTQVSQFTVDEVNSSARKDLEATLERIFTAEFAAKGLIVDQVLLRNISFSPEYAAAIEEKQVALEGEIRAEYEAEQMRNLAQGQGDALRITIRAQSEAEAEAILVKAQAQAAALQRIGISLAQEPSLITYEYVQKLSPNIHAMLLPSDAPLLLPMADLLSLNARPNLTGTVPATVTANLSATLTEPLTITLPLTITPAAGYP
jgi:regulator of protease activity HflC (stomatin/prohibitin superfamily)